MSPCRSRVRVLTGGLVAAAAVAVAVAAGPAGAGSHIGSEAEASRYCGTADIGFATAEVRARNIGCAKARRFVRRSSRRQIDCTEANDFCRIMYYKGFRCVRQDDAPRFIVKVRCKRGSQVITETHGD